MGWVRHLYETVRRRPRAEAAIELPGFESSGQSGHVVDCRCRSSTKILRRTSAPTRWPTSCATPSGRIEIFSDRIAGFGYDDCPGHPAWLEPAEWLGSPEAERFPLHLISNQPTTRLHSQLDAGATSRGEKVAGREPVWIHPTDAAARGIPTATWCGCSTTAAPAWPGRW